MDHRRVDFVLRSIAVHRRARRPRDDGSATALHRAPDQAVDQRILKRGQRRLAARSHGHQPFGIIASRMRHRQKDRQFAAGRMDDGRQQRHGDNFCASLRLYWGPATHENVIRFWQNARDHSIGKSMARILLAEDDTSMREYLQRALQRVGYEVQAVGCGTEAMPLLQSEQFDLLLTDIVMPEMDGIELAQKASAIDPAIRVMFITGFAAVALQGGRTAPEAKLLSKPFHLKDLVMEVDRMFQTEDQHGRL